MLNYGCAQCALHACTQEDPQQLPKNCPMHDKTFFEEALQEYHTAENQPFYIKSSELEAIGYGQWTRLRETIEFCKNMGYTRLGLAFCIGLSKEAKVVDTLLRRHGFEVVSVVCKTGGIPKESAGIPKERKLCPEQFEAMCNPIAQAKLLTQSKTEFNLLMGLCVGHDSMFYKYCTGPVTTLIVKDRVLAHNPVGAVYCADGYYKNKL